MIIRLEVPDDVTDCIGKMVEYKKDGIWLTLLDWKNLKHGNTIFTSALFDYYVNMAEKKTLREIVEEGK